MDDIKLKWENLPLIVKRVTAWISVLAGIAATYGMINIIIGTTIRPAWIWELEQVIVAQQEIQLDIANLRRQSLIREQARYVAMRNEFTRNGQAIPNWLTDNISQSKFELQQLNDLIARLQQELYKN